MLLESPPRLRHDPVGRRRHVEADVEAEQLPRAEGELERSLVAAPLGQLLGMEAEEQRARQARASIFLYRRRTVPALASPGGSGATRSPADPVRRRRRLPAARHAAHRHQAGRRGGRASTSASSGTSASCFGTLVWRDVKVRYKQTFIGVAWARDPAVDDDGHLLARLREVRAVLVRGAAVPVVRVLGAAAVDVLRRSARASRAGASSGTRKLVAKVYFPRVVLPLSAVRRPRRRLLHLVRRPARPDGLVRRRPRRPRLSLLPVFLGLAVRHGARRRALPLGAERPLPRRARTRLPFLIQIWMWLTPVVYAVTALPERSQWVLRAQPDGRRDQRVPLGTARHAGARRRAAARRASSRPLVFFLGGLAYFRRSEPTFADTI